MISDELDNLRNPIETRQTDKLRVCTFGNFEVFIGDKPVEFIRNKSKEVLAYLIDRNGTSATYAELAGVLWEDGMYDRSRQKQLYNYISDLIKSLNVVGKEDIIIKNRKGIMVDVSKLDCDMYNFCKGEISAINAYRGEYMSAYYWAEFTAGRLTKALEEQK